MHARAVLTFGNTGFLVFSLYFQPIDFTDCLLLISLLFEAQVSGLIALNPESNATSSALQTPARARAVPYQVR